MAQTGTNLPLLCLIIFVINIIIQQPVYTLPTRNSLQNQQYFECTWYLVGRHKAFTYTRQKSRKTTTSQRLGRPKNYDPNSRGRYDQPLVPTSATLLLIQTPLSLLFIYFLMPRPFSLVFTFTHLHYKYPVLLIFEAFGTFLNIICMLPIN